MAYQDGHAGSVIQDFQTKNAINKLADNMSNIQALVSLNAQPVASQSFAASYSFIASLVTDLKSVLTAFKTAGLMLP